MGVFIPILAIDAVVLPVKVDLVHSKNDREIFWLPLFFVRVLVGHTNFLHLRSAAGIVDVMGGGEIRNASILCNFDDGKGCLSHDALVPVLFLKGVTKVMAVDVYKRQGICYGPQYGQRRHGQGAERSASI